MRVVKTPATDSTWPRETVRIFKLVIGHSFQIRGFNQVGFPEIWAKDDGTPIRTSGNRSNSLWIEADCLKLVAKKK